MLFRFFIVILILSTTFSGYAMEVENDSTGTDITLKTVEVKSEMLRAYGNHDEIFLSKKNVEFGNNALDAISSLPMFRKDFNSDVLTRSDGRSILILINGRKASSRELMGLQGRDIKKIIFYSDPPAEYWEEGAETVMNVILKTKRKPSFIASLNTMNAVVSPNGNNNIFGIYADSVNMVSASYGFNYNYDTDRRENTSYVYDDMRRDFSGVDGSSKSVIHSANLNWQHEKNNNFFFIGTSLTNGWGRDSNRQTAPYYHNMTEEISDRLYSNMRNYNLDLFFRHHFSGKRMLSVNVVNTYSTSTSNSENIRQLIYQPEIYTAPTQLLSAFGNYNYSIISQATYSTPLSGGRLSVNGYYRYKQLNQYDRINEHPSHIYDNYGLAGVTYQRQINEFGLSATLAGTLISRRGYGISRNYFHPTPRITLSYVSRAMSLRLVSKIDATTPSIGMFTDNPVAIDLKYYSVGNPDLKPGTAIRNELRWEYLSKNQKLYLAPTLTYVYTRHPFMPLISETTIDGWNQAVFMKRPANIDHSNNLSLNLNLTYSPTDWLRMMPYYEIIHTAYRVPGRKITHTNHHPGMAVWVTVGEWEGSVAYNSPFTNMDGDTSMREGSQTDANIRWKHNSFSIGLNYHYQRHYTNRAWGDGFDYTDKVVLNTPRKNLTVTFTYFFNNGRYYRHSRKDLNNTDSDNGLTKETTAGSK